MSIITRSFVADNSTTDPTKPLSKQVYQGAGILIAATLDANSSSSLTSTFYDSARASTADPSIFAMTADADIGLAVPAYLAGDADFVAGTATAGVGHGLIFADGLFAKNTGDSTSTDCVWTFWIKPLHKKVVNVGASATSATAPIWAGPGIWHGYTIQLDPASLALGTVDVVFTDEASPADAGPTLMTKTNYATAGKAVRKVVPTTGVTEAGAAVTTAATGSYGTDGICLRTGLSVSVAQGSAAESRICQISALIER